MVGEAAQHQGMELAEFLRDNIPGLRLVTHCGGGNFKAQFKRADKSDARLALLLGEDEVQQGVVGVKFLREEKPQTSMDRQNIVRFLLQELNLS